MSSKTNRISVLLPVPVDRAYTYRLPDNISVLPGQIVRVPLGPREVIGVVWDEPPDTLSEKRIKDVLEIFKGFVLADDLRKLIDWTANYTLSNKGMVLRMALRKEEAFLDDPKIRGVVKDGPDPERMTSARKRVLDLLEGGLAWSRSGLRDTAGVSMSVIDGLVDQGSLSTLELPLQPVAELPLADFKTNQLFGAQIETGEDLKNAVSKAEYDAVLLDGVTGSGKTEVYFEAVAEAIRQQKQVLVLVPEISLTSAFLDRFASRFGVRPAEWHSDISQRKRDRIWKAVMRNEVQVIVGARSALFLPFADLGVIIVDEEHDGAYKQEERVIYHARDMAVVRAHLNAIPVILASATPSVESRSNVEQGRYRCLRLESRYKNVALPDITLHDMRADPPEKGKWLSAKMVAMVNETIDRDEQALLFLNRRGYAPLTLCRTCGHRFQCPDCSAWLVEHRFRKQLSCHHCGHNEPSPTACPTCENTDSLVACGPGVERIAEEAKEIWSDRHIVVLSSDMFNGIAQLRRELDAIASGEADIVIGTQMVAKGHNFPQMTFVGVVDADLGLAHGDPRAAERTFQTLGQVTGRAGRVTGTGKGFLQTFAPEHPVMQALATGDRDTFYEHDLNQRKLVGLPPFGRLAALIVSASNKPDVLKYARLLARSAPRSDGVRVLGPVDAPLAILRARHRMRLLFQAPRGFDVSGYMRAWTQRAGAPKGSTRLQIDIDPVSFL